MLLGMRQSLASSPVVQALFAAASNDFTTLSTLSTMPTGGSISRAGNAMVTVVDPADSTGKLTYAANNLLTYSEQFNNAIWTKDNVGGSLPVVTPDAGKAPNDTDTADRIVLNKTGGTFSRVMQSNTAVIGTTYIFSVYMKTYSGGTSNVGLRLNGTGVNCAVTGTWQRFTVSITSSNATVDAQILLFSSIVGNDDTADILAWGAQLEAVTYATTPSTYVATTTAAYYGPRFDYYYDTVSSTWKNRGLLVEGARTNLLGYSEAFGSWNTVASPTITPDNDTSPAGTQTADKIALTTTYGGVYRGITASSAATITASVYLKAVTSGLGVNLTITDDSVDYILKVNASTGAVVSASAGLTSYSVTNVGNSWFRLTATKTLAAANPNIFVGIGGASTAGDAFIVWGAQAEVGGFASSYVPNLSSGTTARAAETFSITGYSTNLIDAFYTDEQTGGSYSLPYNAGVAPSPSFAWLTSLRAYQNAYAGDITTPTWVDNGGTTGSTAGNRMYTDSTGMLTYAPANLLTYSQDFRNTANAGETRPWAWDGATDVISGTAPDGSSTANLMTETATNSYHLIYRSNTFVAGTHTFSLYIKANGRTKFAISPGSTAVFAADATFDLTAVTATATSGTASIVSVGNSWYRISVTGVATSGTTNVNLCLLDASGSFSYSGNGSSGAYIWGAQLEKVTYQQQPRSYIKTLAAALFMPRYDYDASVVPATPRGMLIEESRANLVTYSNTLSADWNTTNVTFAQASVTSPTGTGTVAQVGSDGTAAYKSTYFLGVTSTASANYTLSVYVKSNTLTRVSLALISGTNDTRYWYDLSAKTVGGAVSTYTTGYVGSGIQDAGNGWLRCWLTVTAQSTTIGAFIYPGKADVSAAGNVYIYGAQLEAGSFATSYIPTTSASVTRAADIVKLTGAALTTLQGAQMTLAAEAASQTTGNRPLIAARNSAGGNYGDFFGLYALSSVTRVGSADQANLTYSPAPTITSVFRAAYANATNNFAAVANNGTVQTDGTGSVVTGTNEAYLGNYTDGTYVNGWMRSVALYNQRLPDGVLKQKSTVGAPY